MAHFTLRRFQSKLARFSFSVLLLCLLCSTAITFVFCAGYVDGELLRRQESLLGTATELYNDFDLSPEEVASHISTNDYILDVADPSQLSEEQLESVKTETVTTGRFLGWKLYFTLGDTLMSIEAFPASNLIITTVFRSIIGNLIVVVAGYIIVFLYSTSMSLPVVKLTRATRQVAKGNFDIHVDLPQSPFGSGIRELAELADNFNHMIQELKSVEYLRRDFTSNLSHELKSPVASIRGYGRLLQMEGLTEEQRREYVDCIVAESLRLGSLSDNLLRLTRLESQSRKFLTEKYSLDEQIRRCFTMRYPDIQKKELTLSVTLPKILVYLDQDLMEQVWLNLLDNAIKFTPQGGHLSAVISRPDRSHVEVEISDTGIGMDEKTIAHIFEKFYQGDESRHIGGNGLGLPLVKQIVDMMGGVIRVRSVPSEGSTFTIVLPISPARSATKSSSTPVEDGPVGASSPVSVSVASPVPSPVSSPDTTFSPISKSPTTSTSSTDSMSS